jgi:LacI family transcriptional regulator
MDDSLFGTRDKRGNWKPKKRLDYPPVFTWPFSPVQFLKWFLGYPGYILPWNLFGANSAIASVLQRKRLGGGVAWIGHELTDNTRRYLKSGLMSIVLDQAPQVQARRALDTVLRKIGLIDVEVDTEPVRFLTITPENA